MKKLYVGCRVRIVQTRAWPELLGTEAIITDKTGSEESPWYIRPDKIPSRELRAKSCQLEPIQPEGMQPASWADCLWSPESGFRYDKVTA